jgi:hypothetical protein
VNCNCGKPATALAVFVLDDEGRTDYLPVCTAEDIRVGDELDGQTISEIVPWHAGPGYIADREEMFAVRGVQAGMMR